jgi:hypothetical protein
MEIHEKLYLGDVVEMRKPHPCGGTIWEVVRVGADIGLVCQKCGRRVLLPRRKFAHQAKRFVRRGPEAPGTEPHTPGAMESGTNTP